MKKYFKEEKAQKGEVINTKSGHQIRASVKISLAMLDPVSFKKGRKKSFLIKPSNPLFSAHHGVIPALLSFEFFSSVLTTPLLPPPPPAYCTNRRNHDRL